MKTKHYSASSRKPSQQQKANASLVSETLTPSEIAQLKQEKKDDSAFFQKEFNLKKDYNSAKENNDHQ